LILFLVISPGWGIDKILGIVGNALVLASMILSYIGEEKRKKDAD